MKLIRKASSNCFEISLHFEGLRLVAYPDSGGIWTIAKGTIIYPSGPKKGQKVKEGDTCTVAEAKEWYLLDLHEAEKKVHRWVKPEILKILTQGQYDALVDFTYNVGYGKGLFDKVNKNPNDRTIWGTFLLYNKVKSDKDGKDNDKDGLIDEPGEMKEVFGLTRRRQSQAHLYFLEELNFYEDLKRAA
jgi:GH24 family phage-related lysozyme (muramidase)